MPSLVIVQKTGELKEANIKEIDNTINYDELYKKCGFRKPDGFDHIGTWDDNIVDDINYNISLYARRTGKAGTENKYDFPPPEDNTLFFGDTLLLAKQNDAVVDLTINTWLTIYENLFGGFENLNDTAKEDEEEEDELENVPANMKTKTGGYLKDGFVVDDNGDQSSEEEDSACSESGSDSDSESDGESDSGSELEEEKYEYSSDD